MKKVISILLVVCMLFSLVACGNKKDNKNVAESLSELGKTIAEKASDAGEKISETASKVGDVISEKAQELGDKTVETAKEVGNTVGDAAEKAKDAVKNLSLPDFKHGFEVAASFFGSLSSSVKGSEFVQTVAHEIDILEENIKNRIGNNVPSREGGNIAEEWHAGTYDIDAALKNSSVRAKVPRSHDLGSPDIVIDDQGYSLKYDATAWKSGSEQAANYYKKYAEYRSKTENPMSQEEWLKYNHVDLEADSPELYTSVYANQIRVIPVDQLENAKDSLERAIQKNANNVGENAATRKLVAEADLETLKHLTDRIKTADGVESIPLTKEESTALAKAAQDGTLDLADFNIRLDKMISDDVIVKQALRGGVTAAVVSAALTLGPEIYEIIKYGVELGEVNLNDLKNVGVDGLSATADGFLKGSISNALVIACSAGKLGTEYVKASPEIIGTLTVFVIDAIKYGIMMANGKITTVNYIDIIVQELVVGVAALGTATLVGLIFPGVALAIMIGSFVGGLVISAGYTAGKTYVLALIDNYEGQLLVPIQSTAKSIKGFASSIETEIQDILSSIIDFSTKTKDKITVAIYNFV